MRRLSVTSRTFGEAQAQINPCQSSSRPLADLHEGDLQPSRNQELFHSIHDVDDIAPYTHSIAGCHAALTTSNGVPRIRRNPRGLCHLLHPHHTAREAQILSRSTEFSPFCVLFYDSLQLAVGPLTRISSDGRGSRTEFEEHKGREHRSHHGILGGGRLLEPRIVRK